MANQELLTFLGVMSLLVAGGVASTYCKSVAVLWLCLTGGAEITLQLHAKGEAVFAMYFTRPCPRSKIAHRLT